MMVSKHDKIGIDLESRIGQNFHKVLRNHEYGRNGYDRGHHDVIGELDRYMEKTVVTPKGILNYAYVFEMKSTDHYKAKAKAKRQLDRALKKFNPCKKADRVFLYYVTPGQVELVRYEDKLKYI